MPRDNMIVEKYFQDLSEISHHGVDETSYYPPLVALLNSVGWKLRPEKVICINHPKGPRKKGIPDLAFFLQKQRRKLGDPEIWDAFEQQSLPPERGVGEAKGFDVDIEELAADKQVEKYRAGFGAVLVTNFWAFQLIGTARDGGSVKLDEFQLAKSADEFRSSLIRSRSEAERIGERFLEFLTRVLMHNAPLKKPADVAAMISSYAREALMHLEQVELVALDDFKKSLGDALGLTFGGTMGMHLFKSTLVQTLFYGMFSAWVLSAKRRSAGVSKNRVRDTHEAYGETGEFDWRKMHYLQQNLPLIQALFDRIDTTRDVDLIRTLDGAAATLNRIGDPTAFLAEFDEHHAVQHFYEPFLEAFDPELRKQLGVWYTPPEIVEYMVRRVDTVLRNELKIERGLADESVVILDPCCGTGAFLVEVIKRIHATLKSEDDNGMEGQILRKAVCMSVVDQPVAEGTNPKLPCRIFGFEILPAPFVIAHLQLTMLMDRLGAPLGKDDRCGVFLTNSLSDQSRQMVLNFPELAKENAGAQSVKQSDKILVVIGNPPYNARPKKGQTDILLEAADNTESGTWTEVYKTGLNQPESKGGWGIKKFGLDDLYIRFFRLAEKTIAEKGGRGVVSFISNFSYLGDPSLVVMRKRFLNEFDAAWFDCMNGDSRETGKMTPKGKPDPSVFSTDWNREGIRVGTAIGLFVKRSHTKEDNACIRFRHFWGATKRADLVASLDVKDFDDQYATVKPSKDNWWSFQPSNVADAYLAWPKLIDLCGESPSNGLMEKRGGALMDDDRDLLAARMRAYFDQAMSWENLKVAGHPLTKDAARYDALSARTKVLAVETFDTSNLRSYALRPFDNRWCYYSTVRPLWNEPRPVLWKQCWDNNSFLLTRFKSAKDDEGVPFFFSPLLSDDHFLTPDAIAIPLRLKNAAKKKEAVLPGMEHEDSITANLSLAARAYLSSLGFSNPDANQATAELLWMHALAIGYSPAYLNENADGIKQNWPRIPLPEQKELLLVSAKLGREVAALLNTENEVPGVTKTPIRDELKKIGRISKVDGTSPNMAAGSKDISVTVGWGHAGKGGITMPGRGRTTECGKDTLNVWLNDNVCWQNVPHVAWDYYIGGYQVLKKWLSYREEKLLGRPLNADEVKHFINTTRRLTALVALTSRLDENYVNVKANAVDNWQESYGTPAVPTDKK